MSDVIIFSSIVTFIIIGVIMVGIIKALNEEYSSDFITMGRGRKVRKLLGKDNIEGYKVKKGIIVSSIIDIVIFIVSFIGFVFLRDSYILLSFILAGALFLNRWLTDKYLINVIDKKS